MTTYNFKQLPVQEDSWNNKIQQNPEIDLILRKNYNMRMLQEIRGRIIKRNIIVSFRGETGSTKSWSGCSFAEIISYLTKNKYNPRFTFYDIDELLDNLSKFKKHDIITLDEQIDNFGVGSGRMLSELKNVEETVRKKQFHFIFISPTIRTHLHHFILETFALDEKNGISKLIVYTPEKLILGYITLRKPRKENTKIIEERKDKFLKRVTERTTSTKSNLETLAKKLIAHEDWKHCRNAVEKQALASKIFSIGSTELAYVVAHANILSRKGEADL